MIENFDGGGDDIPPIFLICSVFVSLMSDEMRKEVMQVKTKSKGSRSQRQQRLAYKILIPIYGYIMLWGLVPLVYGLYLGLTDYNGLSGANFVGLKNYISIFSNKLYMELLWRQVWIGVLCLVLNVFLAFLVALALNVTSKVRGFFRSAIYVPCIASTAVSTAVFLALMEPNGAVNAVLEYFGQPKIVFSYSQFWMVVWIVVYYCWKGIGPTAIIWLGGLQSIDTSLYEAASIDGANAFQKLLNITLPGLRYVASYIILTGIIGVMQMFDVIMFISDGGPYGSTDTLMYRLYRDGFVNFNLGMAGAESTVLGVVTMIFAAIYFVSLMKNEKED